MTDDGAFRVIVARSTDTVRGIIEAQGAQGEQAQVLGDLITATALFRETMSPDLRVQGIWKDSQSVGTLVADSAPEGHTRGLLQSAPNKETNGAPGSQRLLQMMRTLPNGSINQGIIRINEGASVSTAMMAYMTESEQVDTMLAVGTLFDQKGNVSAAGGYMVQLLPEVGRSPLAIMAQRLEDFPTIEELLQDNFDAISVRDELFYGMPFSPLNTTPLAFSCWCSEDRLLGALATLNRKEIQSMIDDGKPVEITCDYCKKDYALQPSRLRGLLTEN